MNTRKHFQAAAEIVQDLVKEGKNREAAEVADAFVVFFRNDNPRFDKFKFIQACGI
jgi:hypothetical protein